jgi:hypothetical protein
MVLALFHLIYKAGLWKFQSIGPIQTLDPVQVTSMAS